MEPAHGLSPDILNIMILIVAFGGILALVFQQFRLPTFLAFIFTGAILGPDVLNLIQAEEMETLSQIGVIFLLFMVGLELSVDKLKQLRLQAPLAGTLQLGITTVLLTGMLGIFAGMPWQLAFLLGSILSLSSTAIVLKSLEEHGESDTHYGRLILGILIVQDLSIVPLMTLVPALMQPLSQDIFGQLVIALAKAALFAGIAVLVSFKLVPFFLDKLASANKKEIFVLAVICIGLGMSSLTNAMGLSYEAGAFVAGLSLSGSVFTKQVLADSRVFRDVFVTLFFVSMGLFFGVDVLRTEPLAVLAVTAILVVTKFAAAALAVKLSRFPVKTALWSGAALFQVGEFSFVLFSRVLETVSQVPEWHPILTYWRPILVDAIVISMFMTPLVVRYFPVLWAKYVKSDAGGHMLKSEGDKVDPLQTEHIVIAGYGPTAQNLAAALKEENVPYVIVEMNINTIKRLTKKGVTCVYGDISRPEILKEAGIAKARVLALTFPDVRTSEMALEHARQMNPDVYCMVRSRYRADIKRLYDLGADEVIYEEFETSISFIFNILKSLDFPIAEIDRLIGMVRDREGVVFKEHSVYEQPVFGRFSLLEGTKLEWLEIREGSGLIGKTLADSRIRQETGVNVVAVLDGEERAQQSPEPDLVLKRGDVLVVLGSIDQLHELEQLVAAG